MLSFFFHAPPPPEFYTLSLHDALPIYQRDVVGAAGEVEIVLDGVVDDEHPGEPVPHVAAGEVEAVVVVPLERGDRKSTRLNSSHLVISYAVFCLKKKNRTTMEVHLNTQ